MTISQYFTNVKKDKDKHVWLENQIKRQFWKHRIDLQRIYSKTALLERIASLIV